MNYTNYLLQLLNGYKISNALLIASEINLFDHIDGKKTVEDIALCVSADHKALEIILDLFCAVGLVRKTGGIYSLDEELRPLLESDSEKSFMPLFKLENYLSETHTAKSVLKEALICGKGRDLFNENSKENHEEIYGEAMDHGGRLSSIYVAREFLNIANGRILDAGGGAGTYSIQLCRMNKGLEAHIFDKAEMEKACMRNIADNGLKDRIKFFPGDIRYCNFDFEYDGIILSNVLHLFDEETNRKIIKRLSSVLKESGIIVFHDFFLSDDRTGPLVPSIFTLDWLMHGAFFHANAADISDWSAEAGLKVIRVRRYDNIPTSIIVAQK